MPKHCLNACKTAAAYLCYSILVIALADLLLGDAHIPALETDHYEEVVEDKFKLLRVAQPRRCLILGVCHAADHLTQLGRLYLIVLLRRHRLLDHRHLAHSKAIESLFLTEANV